jgi:SAM-dependent methyltransferase
MTPLESPHHPTWIACNACGADAFHELLHVDGWHIGACSVCSLVYVNPMPFYTTADYHDVSRPFYYTRHQREISPVKVEVERRQLRRQLTRIASLVPQPFHPPRFLDVGCGPGVAVRAAVELGWHAVGIDIDAELVRMGRAALGVDLRCSTMSDSRFPAGDFTFVRLKSVLHNLPDPYDVLREVRRVLAPGGVVLITVPNEDGLVNRLHLRLGRRRDHRLGTLVLPYMSHAFTPVTLTRLLDRSALEVLSVDTTAPTDVTYAAPYEQETPPRSISRRALALAWRCTSALGRGSMLVAYAGTRGVRP